MAGYRVKTIVQGNENIYSEVFNTRTEAEEFLKTKLPATVIGGLIADGMIKIYQESSLVDAKGKPIELEINDE